jgi:hypothetical protein
VGQIILDPFAHSRTASLTIVAVRIRSSSCSFNDPIWFHSPCSTNFPPFILSFLIAELQRAHTDVGMNRDVTYLVECLVGGLEICLVDGIEPPLDLLELQVCNMMTHSSSQKLRYWTAFLSPSASIDYGMLMLTSSDRFESRSFVFWSIPGRKTHSLAVWISTATHVRVQWRKIIVVLCGASLAANYPDTATWRLVSKTSNSNHLRSMLVERAVFF